MRNRVRGAWCVVRRNSALILAALALSGCTTVDRAVGAVPWFTTMRDQPGARPFEGPADSTGTRPRFLAPEGSIPVTGREDSLSLFDPAGLRITDGLRNPMVPGAASLARGGKIFGTYCSVCHGTQGGGNGTVAGRFGYVPDLTQDMTRQRSDGYLYAVIRHGRGIMPRYGDKIRDTRDRWHVVNYVRSLQGAVTP